MNTILHLKPKITNPANLRLALGLYTAETLQACIPCHHTLVWSTSRKPSPGTTLIINPHFKEPEPWPSTK